MSEGRTEWLVEAFSRSIRNARELFSIGSDSFPLLIACSGGEDSHVLLHVASALKGHLKIEPRAVYVDHGLRPESGADGEFVREIAQKYGVPATICAAPTWNKRENVEAWARRVRYDLLEKTRESSGAALVATAHHENDQAETVLMRLLSGRLLTDAHSVVEFDCDRRILRPLLRVNKQSIRAYSQENELRFMIDSMNSDPQRVRTKLRDSLFPLLEKDFNPAIIETLGLAADRLSEDERFIGMEAARVAAAVEFPIPLDFLNGLSLALRWRVLANCAVALLGEDARRVGFKAWSRLVEAVSLRPGESCEIELGFGYTANVSRRVGVTFRSDSQSRK